MQLMIKMQLERVAHNPASFRDEAVAQLRNVIDALKSGHLGIFSKTDNQFTFCGPDGVEYTRAEIKK